MTLLVSLVGISHAKFQHRQRVRVKVGIVSSSNNYAITVNTTSFYVLY